MKTIMDEKVDAFVEGYIEGLTAFAWWKDGVQYVGTCGTTLKQAIENARKEAHLYYHVEPFNGNNTTMLDLSSYVKDRKHDASN